MKLAIIAAASLLMATTSANAVTFTFESGVDGNAIGAISGATFTDGQYFGCGGGCPAPSNGLFGSSPNLFGNMTVTFASLQSSISFVNVSFSAVSAQAFDAGNVLLASLVNTNNTSSATGALTLNGPGISYVVFSGADAQYGIDDLTYTISGTAVPEPASWAMLIAGFGLTGAALRRRRSVAVAA